MSNTLSSAATRLAEWPLVLLKAVAWTLSLALPLLAFVVTLRRAAGALAPLPPGVLLLAGLLLALWAVVVRALWQRMAPVQNALWQKQVSRWLPLGTLLLFGLALSIAGTPLSALVIFWLILAGEELISALAAWHAHPPQPTQRPAVVEHELRVFDHETHEVEHLLPPGVSQQMIRSRGDDGGERLTCLVRVAFAAGEATQAVHLAFCPPLCGEPAAQVELLDGPDVEWKLAALATYGARLEVKRRGQTQLADEAIVEMRVVAEGEDEE